MNEEPYRCNETIDLEDFLKMSFDRKTVREAIDNSCYTNNHVASLLSVHPNTLRDWMDEQKEQKPNNKNQKKMEEVLPDILKNKRMERHPSFGYATKDQIEKLKTLPVGLERTALLEKIAKQSKMKSKTK